MNALESLYPMVKDCLSLEKQITVLENDIDYYRKNFRSSEADAREVILKQKRELFFVLGCDAKLEAKKLADTKKIFDKYSTLDQQRIESDSYSSRNTLIVIAGITLLLGTFIIIKNKSK